MTDIDDRGFVSDELMESMFKIMIRADEFKRTLPAWKFEKMIEAATELRDDGHAMNNSGLSVIQREAMNARAVRRFVDRIAEIISSNQH